MSSTVRKQILENGLTVLTERMEHVHSVAIGVWLRRGSRHETSSESGLAHFIEHMVFKGTGRRSQAQIAQEMDAIGGQTDAFTSQEYAGFHAKVLDEHLPRAADLLFDIVLNPSFDAQELERERNVILEEMKSVEDSPEELVHEIFGESFWPRHPLGRPILGLPESVSAFGREDLSRFFRKTYAPSNIIISAAGHLEHEALFELVARSFETLATPPDGLSDDPPEVAYEVRLKDKDLELAHLVLGTPAPAQAHPDRFVAYILNAILGGNLSSRLFQVIREERGLVYSVYSGLSGYRDAGQFSIYAGADPKNIAKVVELSLAELVRIRRELVPEEELQRAKDHIRGSLLLGLETSGSRMSQLARHEMYFGRQLGLDELLAGIDAVGREDVLRLATELFEDRPLALTLLGRLDDVPALPERLVA